MRNYTNSLTRLNHRLSSLPPDQIIGCLKVSKYFMCFLIVFPFLIRYVTKCSMYDLSLICYIEIHTDLH
jgi:hypothetical protein